MPIELDYEKTRELAKKLREASGRDDIKHTQVIAAIAAVLGRNSDALMHELKNETKSAPSAARAKPAVETREPHAVPLVANTFDGSVELARQAGLFVWDTGGGCLAFAKILKEEDTSRGDTAKLDVMVTLTGGDGIAASPLEMVWMTGVNYQDPRGSETVYSFGSDEEPLSLYQALEYAYGAALVADRLWEENYDASAIEAFLERSAAPLGPGR